MNRVYFNARFKRCCQRQVLGRVLFIIFPGFIALSCCLQAQDADEVKFRRFDFTPLVSYRGGMNFPIEPNLQGSTPKVVLNASLAYGIAFGVRIREDDVIEFRWTRQNSYARVQDAAVISPSAPVRLDQFHCDLSREYVPRRWPSLRPFILGSVGATSISEGSNGVSTRLSVGIGGGVKVFVSRHVGFRMQAEWLPIFTDPQGTAPCGPGCVVHLGGALASQGEVAVGPILRF